MKYIIITAILLLTNFNYAYSHGGEKPYAEHENETQIKTIKLTDNVFMLQGEGGNIGVLLGNDKVIIIDSQFGHLSEKIKTAVEKLSDKPIDFLVNTHFHFDHTDGNENFANSGAHIIAHENARKMLKSGAEIKAFGKIMEPAKPEALPVITYNSDLNIYAGEEEIELIYFPHAHTNSDTAIFFKTANAIHTGDIYFNGMYPFIDISNGGSVAGYIAAMEAIIARADRNTKIIPGHGELSNKLKMQKDLNMLKTISANVNKAVSEGKTTKEILELSIMKEYDAEYGNGVLNAEQFIEIIRN